MNTIGNRNVACAEATNIIPSTVFYNKLLSDNSIERQRYFQQFLSIAKGCDLVFFDPDNGLEVKSKPYGRKYLSKYLYWHELLSNYDCFDDLYRYSKVDDVEVLVHDVCFNVPPRYIESQFETEIIAESG